MLYDQHNGRVLVMCGFADSAHAKAMDADNLNAVMNLETWDGEPFDARAFGIQR